MEPRTFEEPDPEPEPREPMVELLDRLREQREAARLHRTLTRDYRP